VRNAKGDLMSPFKGFPRGEAWKKKEGFFTDGAAAGRGGGIEMARLTVRGPLGREKGCRADKLRAISEGEPLGGGPQPLRRG